MKTEHGRHIIRGCDAIAARVVTRVHRYGLDIHVTVAWMLALIGERFQHDYIVMELEGGGFLVSQLWSDGDVELTACDSLEACHALARACARGVGDCQGAPQRKASSGAAKSVGDVAAWVRGVDPKYKLHGYGQYNCQVRGFE